MNKDKLIQLIGSASQTKEHELLVEFMDEFGLYCLQDATEEQLEQFIKERCIDGK